jgi:CBS domain containing-hemolysin-like protein
LYPLVWFSQFITRVLKKEKARSVFTRKDFLAMTEVGAEQGVFEKHESDIISSLLRFNTVRAMDVMTPRVVVKAASRLLSIGEVYEIIRDVGVSRIPLYQGESKDSITGYVLKDELLVSVVEKRVKEPVHTLERKIISVPEDFPIPELFKRFVSNREHIALVAGDFGGMSGIVTMEDIIETILGLEIVDESDHAEDLQALARQNWQRRARSMGLIESPGDGSPESDGEQED